jgi:protein-disulfide isomerase
MRTTQLTIVGMLCLLSAVAIAQQPDGTGKASGRSSKPLTQEQGDAIISELSQIRTLLEKMQRINGTQTAAAPQQPAPRKLSMSIGTGWNALGQQDAPVTIVEFSDSPCPFCRNFEHQTLPELKKSYIETGKVRFYSRDLPLEMHANAMAAAEAARCAGDQGRFWEMRDVLTASSDLRKESILKFAQGISLEMKSFESCLDGEKFKADIEKDGSDAASLQISGTPTFVVGRVSNGVLSGTVVSGAQAFSVFQSTIQDALKKNL